MEMFTFRDTFFFFYFYEHNNIILNIKENNVNVCLKELTSIEERSTERTFSTEQNILS